MTDLVPAAAEAGEENLELYEHAVVLGRFVRGLSPETVPAPVWQHAKTVALDTMGCIVGGCTTAPAAVLLEVTRSLAGKAEATVLGTDIRTDCASAAGTNAYLADILDFEDTLVSHPSASIVPAALAVGERVGASGADLVRAIIAGYEVGCRIGEAIQPSLSPGHNGIRQAWMPLASAAAAAALLDLDDSGWANALGYAGRTSPLAQPSLHSIRPLTWVKGNWHAQTQAGVFAALVARAGFQARTPMVERDGMFATMLGAGAWRPEVVTAGLGESWLIADTTLKPYPCCRYIHPTLDAIEGLMRQESITADDVTRVVVKSSDHIATKFGTYRPPEIIDAEFSVPYTVSMMLLEYPYGPRWHDPANLVDPAVHAVADRVHVEEDSAYTHAHERRRYGASVEITLVDGRTLTAAREHPRGGTDEPVPEDETRTKFRNLCQATLGEGATDDAYVLLRDLDKVDDVRTVTAMLSLAG